jgi:hypothetical protein
LLLPGHELVEAFDIDREPALGGEELGHVEGEAVGVVELEGDGGWNGRMSLVGLVGPMEKREAAVEGAAEGFLLGADHAADDVLLGFELGEDGAEGGDDGGDELLEEAGVEAELLAVEDAAAEDAADDVVAALVGGEDAVGDRAAHAAGVVGEDAEGDVGVFLFGEAFAFLRDGAGVGFVGELGDFREERGEDVGGVVRRVVGEILEAAGRRVNPGDALEAHAGVDVPGGERGERAVGVGVELDEDVVPDLDAARVAGVDEGAAGGFVVGREQIEMDFGARAAGAGVAHHPEIILLVAVDDVDGGIEAGALEDFRPDVAGLLVEVGGIVFRFVGRIDGGEEAPGGDAPDFREKFPTPFERLALEVVAEGPVAEHLEERVVVGVEADILEVVVLAAGADAFLGVGGAGVLHGREDAVAPAGDVGGAVAEEDGDELIHPGVGEEQAGGFREQRRGFDDRVAVLLEEIEERLADLGGSHCTNR